MKRLIAFVVSLSVLGAAYALSLKAAAQAVPSNRWASVSDMSTIRAGASGTLLLDGRVLVAGGINENGAVMTTAERFSLNGGAFLATAAMQTARANHTATLLPDGHVLVVGGTGADGRAVPSAETYDPEANVWLPAGSLHVARRGHTATRLWDGTLLVSGGDDGGTATNTLEVFDPVSMTFSIVNGTLSAARTLHAAAALNDGRVFISGGYDGFNPLASTDIYDSRAGTVVAGPDLSTPRSGLSATTLLGGRVLVAGGAGPGGELATAELFDPVTNAFAATGNALASPRQNHLAFLLPHNNQVLIVGGTMGGDPVAIAETYVSWEGTGGSFCSSGGVGASGVCASGYAAPGLPTAARAWAAGSMLSFPAGDSIRTGPHDGVLVLAGGTGLKSAELYGFATIKTDQSDYSPGTTVTITGGGWQPGESVALVLREEPLLDTHPLLDVTADANGNIVSTEFVPDEHDANVRFYLTAYGSTSQAQTTFTDSPKVGAVSVSSPTGAVTYGTVGSVTYTITVSRGGGPGSAGNFTANLSVTTSLPSGATASFSPNPVQLTSSDTSKTSTMTMSTTATTPAGSTSFTVEARTSASDFATGTGSLTVAKKSVTPTVTASNRVYDGTTAATITACTLSGALPGDVGNLSCSAAGPNAFLDKSVGTSKTVAATNIALSGSASSNYQLSTTTAATTANIAARAITVTAATNIKTYDGTTTAAAIPTITSGTLAPGDTAGFTEVYSNKHVGSGKTLTPSGTVTDGNRGNNYTYTFVNNTTGVINARTITVTAATDTKTYDGTTSSTGVPTVTVGSLGTGDTASFAQAFANKNVGTGKTIIPSGSVTDANSGANYTVTFVNNTTGVINARGITVTAATDTKTYDGTTSSTGVPTMTAGSLGTGDTASFTQAFANKNVGTGKTIIPSGSVTDGNSGANYTVTFVNNTTGVINAREITVTAATDTKTYDGTTSSTGVPTMTAGSLGTGDTASFTQAFANKNVGTGKTIIPNGSVTDGNSGANYTVTFVNNTTGVINAREITVTAATDTKTYDGTTSSTGVPTMTVGSLGAGDTASFTQAFANKNVGTGKTIIPSGSVTDGNSGANYTVTFVNNTTGTINARAITVTAVTDAKDYDGTTASAGVPMVGTPGLATGDTAAFTQSFDTRHAGTGKTLTPAGAVSDSNSGNNYAVTFTSVSTGVIKKAALTLTAVTNTKTYDATTSAAATPTTSGLIAGDTVTGLAEAYADANAGTGKTLSVIPGYSVNDGNVGNNYAVTTTDDHTGVINKATPTVAVSFTASPITYDGASHPATVMVTGVSGPLSVPGEGSVAIAYLKNGSPSATPSDAGSYTASASFTATSPNYNDASSTVNASLTITKADATVSITPYGGTYDGSPHSLTGTATGAGGVDLSASLAFGASFANVPGGTATWTFTGGPNYKDQSGTGNITISQATPTVSVTGGTFAYSGTAHAASGFAYGVGGVGDVLTPAVTFSYQGTGTTSYPSSATPPTNAGTYQATVSFSGNGNYMAASNTAALTINKAHPTVTTTGGTFIFDGNPHGSIGTAKGVDGLTNVAGSFVYTYTPGGSSAPVNASVTPYGVSAAFTSADPNYENGAPGTNTITISKAPATVTLSNLSHIFDGNSKSATATTTPSGLALVLTYNGSPTPPTAVGSYTVVGTVNDTNYAGSATGTLTIAAWRLTGFYSPVDMTATATIWNIIKGGSTVPLKFNMYAGTIELTSPSDVQGFMANGVSCTGGNADDIEFVTTGGTSLRYDTTGRQFIQNWKTPTMPGACFEIIMTARDGSKINKAYFKLK